MSKTAAAEKVRVYILAEELKLKTKDLLEVCKELGFESVKNQLTGLEPDQVSALRKRVKDGPAKGSAPVPHAKPSAPSAPPKVLDQRVRTLAPVAKPKPVATAAEAHPVVEPTPAEQPAVETLATPVEAIATPSDATDALPLLETPATDPVPPIPTAPPPASHMPAGVPIHGKGVADLLRPRSIGTATAGNKPRNLNQPPHARPPQPGQHTPPSQPGPATGPAVAPPQAHQPPPPVSHQPQFSPPPPAVTPVAGPRPVNPPQGGAPSGPRPIGPTPGPGPRTMPHLSSGGGQRSPMGPGGPPRPGQGPSGPGGPVRPHSNFPPPNAGMPPPRSATGGVSTPQGPPRVGPPGPRPPIGGAPPGGAKGSMKLTPEQIKKLRELEQRRGKMSISEVQKQITDAPAGGPAAPGTPGDPAKPGARVPDRGPAKPGDPLARRPMSEEDDKKKKPGEVAGRANRTAGRHRDRPAADKGSIIIGAGGQVDMIEQAAGSRKGPRAALLAKMKRRGQQVAVKKEGPVEIALPITVRTLSEAIGVKLGDLSKQLLKETQQLYGANSPVAFDVAELIAINKGITLVGKKQKTAKELLLSEFERQANEVDPEKLRPRPPIVVIMGHVDHGKTSLLDKIRQEYGLSSDVVSTEAGGITQVLRAWRVEKDGKPVTFLDTPGHEAFTKMRARGANVTDVAVIVVAATDGVRQQTDEAIAHARAADVDIIVAINKIDMPNADVEKTRRELYQRNLLPDNMGGDVQFVETSAVTGAGVGDLLDAIGIQAELSDPPLTADPEHKPSGTCLEAYMAGDKGVMATLLVRQGTLRKGDVILCGATHGRVRSMFDDLGRAVTEAGPSTPVKVFGLDAVPDADDPFYFVEDVTKAAEIAEQERQLIREAELNKFQPVSLDSLRAQNAKVKVTELKVILKAEARGSVEAIKKELEKLVHEEVRCRVLLAGIGAITESDVTLALTSPADTLVIGFNVTADDEALRLAEARDISLREYQIIYNLVDDVKAALEGRLKPIEEVVHLGRAIVREAFKVSKVGTIAGCYVTSGLIERTARVRVIREGAVIYPPAEKTLGLDSLKRFKDDAKEVREGFECGLKITGFDDVKVGDVIEAFRIDIKQRTL